MGLFKSIKDKISGMYFGETVKDFGVIAEAPVMGGTETYSLFIASKNDVARLHMKIQRRGTGKQKDVWYELDRNAAQQLVTGLYEALQFAEQNNITLS